MQVHNVNLPITVTGRHVSVTEPMRDYAQKKVENLHLDYPRIIDAKVIPQRIEGHQQVFDSFVTRHYSALRATTGSSLAARVAG